MQLVPDLQKRPLRVSNDPSIEVTAFAEAEAVAEKAPSKEATSWACSLVKPVEILWEAWFV